MKWLEKVKNKSCVLKVIISLTFYFYDLKANFFRPNQTGSNACNLGLMLMICLKEKLWVGSICPNLFEREIPQVMGWFVIRRIRSKGDSMNLFY